MTHYRIPEMTESLVGKASNCFDSELRAKYFAEDFLSGNQALRSSSFHCHFIHMYTRCSFSKLIIYGQYFFKDNMRKRTKNSSIYCCSTKGSCLGPVKCLKAIISKTCSKTSH